MVNEDTSLILAHDGYDVHMIGFLNSVCLKVTYPPTSTKCVLEIISMSIYTYSILEHNPKHLHNSIVYPVRTLSALLFAKTLHDQSRS